jgi:hypothetical protein
MATKGSKTRFEFGNGITVAESTTWTPFAKVLEVHPPKIKADDIDTSHMESEEEFKEFDPGWAEGGDVEIKIQFEKVQNETIYGLFRQPKGYRMVFNDAPQPSGSKWKFSGYINGFANEVDRAGIVTADVTVKITGKPVFEKAV